EEGGELDGLGPAGDGEAGPCDREGEAGAVDLGEAEVGESEGSADEGGGFAVAALDAADQLFAAGGLVFTQQRAREAGEELIAPEGPIDEQDGLGVEEVRERGRPRLRSR